MTITHRNWKIFRHEKKEVILRAFHEGFYASIVYSFFTALGYDLIAEDVTNQGRIDLTLILPDKVVIIEFKLTKYGDATAAIEQIKTRGYAEKYRDLNRKIYLLGMSFDPAARNISDFKIELDRNL